MRLRFIRLGATLGLITAPLLLASIAFAAFKVPAIEKSTLDNGLSVFFIRQNEVPLIHITFGLAAGSSSDGARWGLASLTTDALTLGTQTFSKHQLEEKLDFYGIEYETSVQKDYLTLDASLAAADLAVFMPILAELVLTPQFPAKELDKLRERTVSQLRKDKDSPSQIAGNLFQRMVYGQHPYAAPEAGVAETVQKLKSLDLHRFHRDHFQPQMTALTVAGDFDPKQAKALIDKHFGAWKKGSAVPLAHPPAPQAPSMSQVLLLDKEDAQETSFRLGGFGVPRGHKDWIPLAVINTVLGGRFTSILNEELRVKSGYTYGARSALNGWRFSGLFQIATFTATDTTFQTLDLALETYKKFTTEGIDQKTLDSAKAYVKGQFPPRYETLESLSELATELWAFGLTLEDFNNFESQVDRLTLEEANRLIRSQLPQGKLQILLIGKASAIATRARQYGEYRQRPIVRADSNASL